VGEGLGPQPTVTRRLTKKMAHQERGAEKTLNLGMETLMDG
jgi:hypothetical protein